MESRRNGSHWNVSLYLERPLPAQARGGNKVGMASRLKTRWPHHRCPHANTKKISSQGMPFTRRNGCNRRNAFQPPLLSKSLTRGTKYVDAINAALPTLQKRRRFAHQSNPSKSPFPLSADASWIDHCRLRMSGSPSASDTLSPPQTNGITDGTRQKKR